jgi:Hypothetical glycosyl hydrolase family 15
VLQGIEWRRRGIFTSAGNCWPRSAYFFMPKCLVILLIASSWGLRAATIERASQGVARFVVRTDPSWDKFTKNPSPDMQSWFRSKVWRMEVYSTYWDSRLAWYPNAWVYINLYAIYVDSDVAKKHPEWILKDEAGEPLYIPWGCGNGHCPQYAGNVADPAFRKHWINSAQHLRQIGYKGFFVDDVNLEYRVADAFQNHKTVINPKTKSEITFADWKKDVADFAAQIRKTFPDAEIVHNAIWFAGGKDRINDPSVEAEVSSADLINLERGANDSGLRGGNGEWSLNAFMNYIDGVHKLGSSVILDSTGGKTEYSLAVFFLISSGKDAFGDQGLKPDHWWPGLDVDLGDALGPREQWQGLIRRRFSRGVVIVNPPDSKVANLKLSAHFRRADGTRAGGTIPLGPAGAVILVGPVERGKSIDSSIAVAR